MLLKVKLMKSSSHPMVPLLSPNTDLLPNNSKFTPVGYRTPVPSFRPSTSHQFILTIYFLHFKNDFVSCYFTLFCFANCHGHITYQKVLIFFSDSVALFIYGEINKLLLMKKNKNGKWLIPWLWAGFFGFKQKWKKCWRIVVLSNH